MNFRTISFLFFLTFLTTGFSQEYGAGNQVFTPGNGVCELPLFGDWGNGNGMKPCACKWLDKDGVMMCAFGNCNNDARQECESTDCAGGQDSAAGWYQGDGNQGAVLCAVQLPVTWSYFVGLKNGSRIDLTWGTVTEYNNDYFEVLHSRNGVDFQSLETISSVGNTQSSQKYIFQHHKVYQGVHYYKIRQYDLDGEYSETSVILVDNTLDLQDLHFSELYPNPVSNSFRFNYFDHNYKEEITVLVYSTHGELMKSVHFNPSSSDKLFTVNVDELQNGVYWVKIIQGDVVAHKKIIISK